MCGITGIVFSNRKDMLHDIGPMTKSLHHRGPDSQDCWISETQGVALGHARLSIHDLSSCGAQPMFSRSGRLVVVFNGEIYNFLDLKKELCDAGAAFRGGSDTEVLVEYIDMYGVEACLSKCHGMFAIACWNLEEKCLYLARDRFGEKPLYYGWQHGVFLFGSELKAMGKSRAWNGEIDLTSMGIYLQQRNIPAPTTIFKDVKKLLPGHYLKISSRENIVEKIYWDPRETALKAKQESTLPGHSLGKCTDKLDDLLNEVISYQSSSDVPLGAFLSGGVDSSLVTAILQSQNSEKIKTFCIGFKNDRYNEATYAENIAKHLGTDHLTQYLDEKKLIDIIPKMSEVYDEPFSDPSQLPTYLVSKLARSRVTVSLSGDGGDELFGGYNRYAFIDKLYRRIGNIPEFASNMLMHASNKIEEKEGFSSSKISLKFVRFSNAVKERRCFPSFYNLLTSAIVTPSLLLNAEAARSQEYFKGCIDMCENFHPIEKLLMCDTVNYLPGEILTKVDRAAMAHGLETRIPFLDHKIYEFAWGLPLHYKCSNGQGKIILKNLLSKYVPRELFEREKMGFGVPMEDWLQGVLRDWVESLLHPTFLKNQDIFNVDQVRRCWNGMLSGKVNYGLIWTIVMFQSWYQNNQMLTSP